ncbi:MAG: hypothetical protein HKO59_11680, partial [Phycisphaerales bacterium]|nr:hypothetical protein [Phycisphaerales bacterium]
MITRATLMIGMLAMLGFSAGTIAAKVTAEEGVRPGPREHPGWRAGADGEATAKPRRSRRGVPATQRRTARFDLDDSGSLDEQERAAMEQFRADRRAAMQARRAEMIARFDADGDGRLTGEERTAARSANRAEIMERFDADGDGRLSREERRVAMKELPRRRRHRGHAGQAGHAGHAGHGGPGHAGPGHAERDRARPG